MIHKKFLRKFYAALIVVGDKNEIVYHKETLASLEDKKVIFRLINVNMMIIKRLLKMKFLKEKENFEIKKVEQQNIFGALSQKNQKFTKKLHKMNKKLGQQNVENNKYRRLNKIFTSWIHIKSGQKYSLTMICKFILQNLLRSGLDKISQRVKANRANEKKYTLFIKLIKATRKSLIKQLLNKWWCGTKLTKITSIELKNQENYRDLLRVNSNLKILKEKK